MRFGRAQDGMEWWGSLLAFLAVLTWALVPQGTMAAAGPEGPHLVICSSDGPVTMVIAADGSVQPASADQRPATPMDPSHCPCVAGLSAAALPSLSLWPPVPAAARDTAPPPRALSLGPNAAQVRPESRAPPVQS
jgi:hypothetical protein